MIIETIEEQYSNTYLVGNEQDFVIIDPSVDVRNILYIIRKKFPKSKLAAIILTHGHYDHFVSIEEVQKNYKVPVYIGKEDLSKLTNLNLSCGFFFGLTNLPKVENVLLLPQELKLGSLNFKIINTPGHTNGSVCIKLENHLFTGDTLFNDGVGRTDLPTGNVVKLNESIKMLMKLDDDLEIYPGHGPSSTIGYEKNYNYYYRYIKNND